MDARGEVLNLAIIRILFLAEWDLIWVVQELDTIETIEGGSGLGQSILESDVGITLVADGAEALIERILQLFLAIGADPIFVCGEVESACAQTAMPTAGSCGGVLVSPGRMRF